MMKSLLYWLKPFKTRKVALAGLIWLIAIIIAALFAGALAPLDPLNIDPMGRLLPPNLDHPFGTDHFGRDTLSRCIYGTRMAMVIGFGAVLVALGGGTFLGTVSGYFPRVGNVLMRCVDVLMSFPSLLLALALMTILGRGVTNTVIAIGIVYMTTTARILYGMTLKLKSEVYVEAARCIGVSHTRILLRHILPNLLSPLLVQASFIFAFAQLQAASLDFLGLGIPPEIPSWGNMLSESRLYVTRASWLLIFPGLLIILSVFSMNLVGDVLRDRIDPRFKDDIKGV